MRYFWPVGASWQSEFFLSVRRFEIASADKIKDFVKRDDRSFT